MPTGNTIVVSAEGGAMVARSVPTTPPAGLGLAPATAALTSERLGGILDQEEAAARVSETKIPGVLEARESLHRRLARTSKFPLALVLGWRRNILRRRHELLDKELHALVERYNQSHVAIRFRFGHRVRTTCESLVLAHKHVCMCSKIWSVAPDRLGTPGAVLHGGSLSRRAASAHFILPEQIAAGWPALALRNDEAAGLDIFPGFILVRTGAQPGRSQVVHLLDAHIEARDVMVAEQEAPPTDATVATYTWVRTTKDGAPDRRYSDNPRIPVVRYGMLHIEAPGTAPMHLLTSIPDAAAAFAGAFASVQQAIAAEMAVPPDGHADDRGWLGVSGNPVDGATKLEIPPPPLVSAAHEYTVAGLVALVVGFGLLSGGPRPDLTAQQPGTSTAVRAAVSAPTETAGGEVAAPVSAITEYNAGKISAANDPGLQPGKQVSLPSAAHNLPSPPSASVSTQKLGRVVARNAGFVRAGPDNTAAVVRTATGGSRMNVFSRSNGWVQVGDTEPWGWIWSGLVEPAE